MRKRKACRLFDTVRLERLCLSCTYCCSPCDHHWLYDMMSVLRGFSANLNSGWGYIPFFPSREMNGPSLQFEYRQKVGLPMSSLVAEGIKRVCYKLIRADNSCLTQSSKRHASPWRGLWETGSLSIAEEGPEVTIVLVLLLSDPLLRRKKFSSSFILICFFCHSVLYALKETCSKNISRKFTTVPYLIYSGIYLLGCFSLTIFL